MSLRFAINRYTTLVFDCDGVVLNSNKVKTEAFYQTALPYGEAAAQALVDYHVANGGVSRYRKFAVFLQEMVPVLAPNIAGPDLDALLANYARRVREGLLTCEVAEGLDILREKTANAHWLIVSGGDQAELREVFAIRELADLFDGGIFGSPATKDEILFRECGRKTIRNPALFLGDSKYDFQAAENAKLDFIFVNGWSEVQNHERWCSSHKIASCKSLKQLIPAV